MSQKCDALKQVRLDPDNHRRLKALKKALPVKYPLGSLANSAINRGLPILVKEFGK